MADVQVLHAVEGVPGSPRYRECTASRNISVVHLQYLDIFSSVLTVSEHILAVYSKFQDKFQQCTCSIRTYFSSVLVVSGHISAVYL